MDNRIRSEHLNNHHSLVEIFNNNVAKIKQDRKTIKSIRSVYAKGIVNRHTELLEKIMGRPQWKDKITPTDRQVIVRDTWRELQFMNPHRIIPCQEATLRALEAYQIPMRDVSAFTVIDRTLETSNTIFQREAIELETSDNNVDRDFDLIKKKFQHGLRGYNYIAVMEFAIFDKETYEDKNAPENDGWLIAPHLQGLIWKDGGLLKEDIKHLRSMFRVGGRWNAKGFKRDRVYDITGSVSYMHKLPLFAYTNTYRHTSKPLPQNIGYLMFQRLKHLPFEKLFISGGEGKNIRTVTLNYLKDFYEPYQKKSA